MIELLIVIALLGALAVGLLAALDPFEQLKKGNDTSVRNLVSEVHGSVIRYYALKSMMPYCDDVACASDTLPSGDALTTTTMSTAIESIVTTGELKSNFQSLAGNNLQRVFTTGTSDSVRVCFQPTSKSFRCDPNTKYTQYGVEDAVNCPGATCGTMSTCYWCVQ